MTPREKFVAALDTMLSDYGHVIGRYGRDPVSNLKQSKDALLSLYDEAARPVAAGKWYRWTDMDGYQRITEGLPSVDHAHPDSIPQPIAPVVAQEAGECDCHRCIADFDLKDEIGALPLSASRMILCPTCGNKRCPKASDHRLACTGSNEPGQPGSIYGGIS